MHWTNTTVKLSQLDPWEENPKSISKKAAKRLLDYWDRMGQFQTIAIGPTNGNELHPLYDGHQRLEVLKAYKGMDFDIDARVSSRALSDDERAEMVVEAHAGAVGQWDWDKLASWDVPALKSWGMDGDTLKQWNVDAAALAAMHKSEEEENAGADTEPQIDKAEELRVKWGVELGQMWACGEHRLICGDCTDKAVVDMVMGGEKVGMMFTDPPYNVSYQDNESIESLKKRNRRTDGLTVSNDSMSDEEFATFLALSLGNTPLVKGGTFYLCAPPGHTETLFRNTLNNVSGWSLRQCIVWVKDQFVFGRQDYHYRHESILYGWIEGAAHFFVDDRTQDTVWEFDRPRVSKNHPTMKPIELPEKAIGNHKGNVYDPFSGSGTTLIACENLNRRCRAVEIDPGYVAVTLQRYADHTGKTPVLME